MQRPRVRMTKSCSRACQYGEAEPQRLAELTIVLNDITSTKPLTTSAKVSATTLVLPTTTTSLPMHSSHPLHLRSIAGILVAGSHRLST